VVLTGAVRGARARMVQVTSQAVPQVLDPESPDLHPVGCAFAPQQVPLGPLGSVGVLLLLAAATRRRR